MQQRPRRANGDDPRGRLGSRSNGNEARYEGEVKLSTRNCRDAFSILMKWADGVSQLACEPTLTLHMTQKKLRMGAEGSA